MHNLFIDDIFRRKQAGSKKENMPPAVNRLIISEHGPVVHPSVTAPKSAPCYYGNSKGVRHSRSDAMTNFPFVDEGGVGDVLHVQGPGSLDPDPSRNIATEEGIVNLNTMSYPGRMRMITKIYHEICSSGGKAGMKFSDIPVALKVHITCCVCIN